MRQILRDISYQIISLIRRYFLHLAFAVAIIVIYLYTSSNNTGSLGIVNDISQAIIFVLALLTVLTFLSVITETYAATRTILLSLAFIGTVSSGSVLLLAFTGVNYDIGAAERNIITFVIFTSVISVIQLSIKLQHQARMQHMERVKQK